jgi:putative phage-type endonuclease
MKSTLTLVPTGNMTAEEWLAFRHNGIGASEVGTVMGVNPYKSSIELFYEKLGQPLMTPQKLCMFLGKEREAFNADLWECWDGTDEGMMKNFQAGLPVRRCKRVNAYVINPKYPWLFVSLDREINQNQVWPGESKKLRTGNGALELKEISGHEADKWESNIPVGYIFQHQQQIGVCEYEYGEIALLRDNVEFSVLPFDFNQEIFEGIVLKTKLFWDKVLEARKVMTIRYDAALNFNQKRVQEMDAELQRLEPEPDGSEGWAKFMKEKYRIAIPGEMAGGLEELAIARQHLALKDDMKALEEQIRLRENQLKNILRDGADVLDFGKQGQISWKVTAKGHRMFLNKVKTEA